METTYQIIDYIGFKCVIKYSDFNRRGEFSNPNFAGTGGALAGILQEGETLLSWIARCGK